MILKLIYPYPLYQTFWYENFIKNHFLKLEEQKMIVNNKKLAEKNKELEKFHELFIEREFRIKVPPEDNLIGRAGIIGSDKYECIYLLLYFRNTYNPSKINPDIKPRTSFYGIYTNRG